MYFMQPYYSRTKKIRYTGKTLLNHPQNWQKEKKYTKLKPFLTIENEAEDINITSNGGDTPSPMHHGNRNIYFPMTARPCNNTNVDITSDSTPQRGQHYACLQHRSRTVLLPRVNLWNPHWPRGYKRGLWKREKHNTHSSPTFRSIQNYWKILTINNVYLLL